MPAKKAAKKSAKKVAKKAPHRHSHHDLRRAYEHLGRIEILEAALAGPSFRDVTTLTAMAQQKLAAAESRDSADLLRAAEHLAFAALAPRPAQPISLSKDLRAAITADFEDLMHGAQDRRRTAQAIRSVLGTLYSRIISEAHSAFAAAAYRPALELARAAEAIARVNGVAGLPSGAPQSRRLERL
jgi:hypothetical protein